MQTLPDSNTKKNKKKGLRANGACSMYRGRRQNNLCFCLNKGGGGWVGRGNRFRSSFYVSPSLIHKRDGCVQQCASKIQKQVPPVLLCNSFLMCYKANQCVLFLFCYCPCEVGMACRCWYHGYTSAFKVEHVAQSKV